MLRRSLGSTGLKVSVLGFGASPLGGVFQVPPKPLLHDEASTASTHRPLHCATPAWCGAALIPHPHELARAAPGQARTHACVLHFRALQAVCLLGVPMHARQYGVTAVATSALEAVAVDSSCRMQATAAAAVALKMASTHECSSTSKPRHATPLTTANSSLLC